jgi:hypothetical protein
MRHSQKYKLRLIGQHEVTNKKDVATFKEMVAEQEEHTSPFDLLHSMTTHPTSKSLKINTYLKVELEEKDSGRDQPRRCG